MTISKNEIEQKIKIAYEEARQWAKSEYSHTYAVMLDTTDGSIWADLFLSENTWKKYPPEIVRLSGSQYIDDPVASYVNDAIEELKRAGNTVE